MPPIELDWPLDAPVLVACSGGSDSLALLYLLREQGRPLLVAHLDHAARPDSHRPADSLERLCRDWGIPFYRRRLQVERWARRYGMSWEAMARELRYHWLSRLARGRGALLVTAHTLDDQAETFLLRLVQGTTLSGLAGIQARNSRLCRPLLGWTRRQLQAELRARGVEWFEDPGNQDPRFPRVRLRHEVLPLLEQLNSGVSRHLAQLAQDAFELREWLRQPMELLDMGRLQFEEFFHDCWRELKPPPGVRFQRRQATEIYRALSSSEWRTWNLPGDFWAEWDGRRLSLGRARTLPTSAPPGCVWRFRQPGDRWQDRSLKKMLPVWRVPRRARDQVPLLVRPPHQVLAVLGFAGEPEVAAWVPRERSGLLIVEARAGDEQATD
ncbi:MAG: tRNA lysidine(34) synthetase TilS [Candidatus Eremiobacteraeota bacterium]|nr:tRNA lysidine(34) synthetase TilS [Candidatus Eremiobacteraeota bacterium]MCW5867803.1 tRNA lysidine(34) synthetase TilS [Candidatus Eremiobacteraeota bacterium]